jgi:hypothetical protein
MECKFCKNVFSTKANFNSHQKNAKYCLKLRGQDIDTQYKCNGCGKTFSRSYHLNRHEQSCKSNDKMYELETYILDIEKERDIYKLKLEEKESQLFNQQKMYESQIKSLQDKLENIAIKAVQRPTTTNMNKTQINNFIQNMEPISCDHLLEQSSNLTLEHIKKGASGYAEYALEYPLKDRIACVDYSRRKIKFKSKDGDLIADPEMVKLAPMFFDSIKNKSSEIVYELNKKDMNSSMFEEVAKLFNTNSDVNNGATGIKTEFYHDFVKHVCSGSVVVE